MADVDIEKLAKSNIRAKDLAVEAIELGHVAADKRISNELFVRIFRATLIPDIEQQEREWLAVIDELKALD